MARDEIDDFSPDSIAEIAKSVRTLRWQVQNIQELAKQLKRHRPTHEIRTGVMKAEDGETYPEKGCVLPVQFNDFDFDETVGLCEDIKRAPWEQKFIIARAYDGKYIAEDTEVLIVKVAATKGRRWWIIPLPTELVLLSPVTCFEPFPQPAAPQEMYLWKIEDCKWVKTQDVVLAEDPNDCNYLLPDETQWAKIRAGCNGPETTTTTGTEPGKPIYDLVGSRGLLRRAKATADIECDATGSVVIQEIDSCKQQTATNCKVDVCNSWGLRQCIHDNDELEIEYIKRGVWMPHHRRTARFRAFLAGEMCPDDLQLHSVTGVQGLDYCEKPETLQAITQATNDYGLSGKAGDLVFLERDNTTCDGKIYITQVRHKCRSVVVAPACETGVFLELDGCDIYGRTVQKSSVMSCTEPTRDLQLSFEQVEVLDDLTDGSSENDCNIVLMKSYKSFCVLNPQGGQTGNITIAMDSIPVIETATIEQDGCAIVLKGTASTICGRRFANAAEAEFGRIAFQEVDAVAFSTYDRDGCDITILQEFTNFCALPSALAPQGDDEQSITFETINAVTSTRLVNEEQSPDGSGSCAPKLKLEYKTTQAMACPGAAEDENWSAGGEIILTEESVVLEIDLGNGCFSYTTGVIYTLGQCGDDAVTQAECEEVCPEGSGSG